MLRDPVREPRGELGRGERLGAALEEHTLVGMTLFENGRVGGGGAFGNRGVLLSFLSGASSRARGVRARASRRIAGLSQIKGLAKGTRPFIFAKGRVPFDVKRYARRARQASLSSKRCGASNSERFPLG